MLSWRSWPSSPSTRRGYYCGVQRGRPAPGAALGAGGRARRARAPERRCTWRLRDQRGDAARPGAEALAARARRGARRRGDRAGRDRARRGRRAGLRQLLARARVVRRGARRDPRRRPCVRQRLAVEAGEGPGRDGVGQPDRPDHRRGRPQRRDRRLGGTAAPARRARGRARVLLQRLGRADGPLPRVGRGDPPPEDGYQGDYVRDLAGREGDPVAPMLAQIEATLERFRIRFDSWALQSDLERRLPDYLPKLDTYERDGAVWARSSAHGDDEDRVLIRSAEQGGAPTYRAADVVYLVDKLERGFDRAIYVLGADHHGTRRWYAAVARMLGYEPERVEVLLYQLVHLTRRGQQAKMSKRRGDVVFLDELVDEVGVDAARWFLVSRGHDQTIEIDVDLAREKSEKNPVYYVQYAHARIAGIRRNAGDAATSAELRDYRPEAEERDL